MTSTFGKRSYDAGVGITTGIVLATYMLGLFGNQLFVIGEQLYSSFLEQSSSFLGLAGYRRG